MVTFDFEPVFDLFGIFIGNIWSVQQKNPNKRVLIEKNWNLEKPRNQPQNSQKPKSPKAQKPKSPKAQKPESPKVTEKTWNHSKYF